MPSSFIFFCMLFVYPWSDPYKRRTLNNRWRITLICFRKFLDFSRILLRYCRLDGRPRLLIHWQSGPHLRWCVMCIQTWPAGHINRPLFPGYSFYLLSPCQLMYRTHTFPELAQGLHSWCHPQLRPQGVSSTPAPPGSAANSQTWGACSWGWPTRISS